MKKFGARICATIVTSLLLTTGVSADPLPKGSYQKSCHPISFNGDMLSAVCKNFDGNFGPSTSLGDVRNCVGDIQNIGGGLACSRATAPKGSYQLSCSEILVTANGIVTARCKTLSGNLNPTGIDSKTCLDPNYVIANVNGELRCIAASMDRQISGGGTHCNSPCGLCTCPLPPPNVGWPAKAPAQIFKAE
jgi:hypothetical protein